MPEPAGFGHPHHSRFPSLAAIGHWCLLALASGSLLLAWYGCQATRDDEITPVERLASGALRIDTSSLRIWSWLVACGFVVIAVGGIGAIHWAIEKDEDVSRSQHGVSAEPLRRRCASGTSFCWPSVPASIACCSWRETASERQCAIEAYGLTSKSASPACFPLRRPPGHAGQNVPAAPSSIVRSQTPPSRNEPAPGYDPAGLAKAPAAWPAPASSD